MERATIFITIVIPVYNEQARISSFLKGVLEYVRRKDFPYEILIVDDGSTDGTVPMVERMLQAEVPGHYRVVGLPVNAGKGAAVRKGMLEAQGEYVFFIDADGSTAIEEIDRFIPHFSGDIDVYSARRTIKQKAPLKRKFFGYGYIVLANLVLGLGVSDITCGFKCYRKKCIPAVFARQHLNNWSFDAENIFVARKHGLTLKEIPVTWEHTSGSKVKVLKNVAVCGLDLFRIRLNDLRGTYD